MRLGPWQAWADPELPGQEDGPGQARVALRGKWALERGTKQGLPSGPSPVRCVSGVFPDQGGVWPHFVGEES